MGEGKTLLIETRKTNKYIRAKGDETNVAYAEYSSNKRRIRSNLLVALQNN